MENKEKYIISVVPLVKILLTRDQFFYYSFSKKIPTGSLVKIPLGKRNIEGITLSNKKNFPRLGNIKLRNISKIIEEKFLTSKQLNLAKFISDYYIVSLGTVMKSFIPKRIKSRKYKTESIKLKKTNEIRLTKEQKLAIKEITKKQKKYTPRNSHFLLYGKSSSGKTQVYFETIKKLISKNRQALILLPEITIASQEIERYENFFGEKKLSVNNQNIAVLHSKISKGKFYENWKNIKSGKTKIIIGTRQAIFAPFKNLKIIVVDEEQDISYKQWEMQPRYNAQVVAHELANKFKAKLILGSATPRISTYYKALKKEYKLLKLSELSHQSKKSKIVDLRNEHWKNWKKVKIVSPISKKLEAEIRYNLKYNQQIILFINHQGMSAFSACVNCKEVLTCPDCERALTYRKKGNYECLHCNFETGDFPTCPKCQEMVFKNVGLGTEKIESEIEKMFPGAKIARADSSSMKKSIKSQQKLWEDFSQKKIDILIGTQMIAKAWDIASVGLVGIIDADSLFSFPDFQTEENAFSLISQATGRTGRTRAKFFGKSIIQTYHPENQIIKWAVEKKYEKFYQYEIKERTLLSYPPFSKIIKLTFQDYSKEKTARETERIYNELSDINKNKFIKIFPSQDPLNPKIRGRYRKQIILKISENKSLSKKIEKIFHRLRNGWVIDVDPINII